MKTKEINKFAEFLKDNFCTIYQGKDYIQIFDFGIITFSEFQKELKKYNNISSHYGFYCTVVE